MPAIECYGQKIELDNEGYLVNFDAWTDDVACAIAEREGITELTKDRLEVIRFMRQYYKQYRAFPILSSVCKNIHQPTGCLHEEFIDPLRAWKIAGLPKPGAEVISYLRK
ncbi:MAG: TusE/DsrC/DsvC family sulfur relay protein [Nitrospirae bacterium]|nr:TusE/DsrC/DsvC family sulfur relay protein [Nitrospirota bacterium]